MVYAFLANGFEDIEALAPIDILRRAGIEVTTISSNEEPFVESAHGITVVADTTIAEACDASAEMLFEDAEMLFLPGGMPGASNLGNNSLVCRALKEQEARKGWIAAICAAPYVLADLGILEGKKATCYPGFESHFPEGSYTGNLVTLSENVITGEGPAAAMELGYIMAFKLGKQAESTALREGMRYNHLIKGQ